MLVLDGDQRAALAVTRALVRAGCAVTVAAPHRRSIAALSRGTRWERVRTNALHEPARYAEEIAMIAERARSQVLLPITDPSVEAVLEHRVRFPDSIAIPFADLAVYRAASNKVRVHEAALEVGLGIEESRVVAARGDEAPADTHLYPGIVKPHRSVVGAESREKTGVRLVADHAECEAALAALPAAAFPVLVQRRVRGAGVGYFALRSGGKTLARFAHRRLREKPPAGGVSVLSESIALDPELQRACDALLDRLDWDGVAMLECKEDLDRGGWRAIEINGRFWGSLQLAIDAGVDFPALLVRSALGLPPGDPPEWRVGQRLRWEWGDVDHLLIRMLRSRHRLSLPADAPGRLSALLRFFAHRPGRDRLELLRLDDPKPFLGECVARLGRGK